MDRTAWIAVTLCVIGLVLWEFYLVKQTPRKPVPVITGPTQASPVPLLTPSASPSTAPTAVAPAIAPKAPEAVPSFPEKIESLRNSDVELRLTNRGGGIKEVVLLNQVAEKGERVVLNSAECAPIGAITDQPSSPELLEFTTSRELNSAVRFERTTAEQVTIRKRFFFPKSEEKKDNFVAEMDVDLENRGSQPFQRAGYFVALGSAAPIHPKDYPYYTRLVWCIDGKAKGIDVGWFAASGGFLGINARAARPFYQENIAGAEWVAVSDQFLRRCSRLSPPRPTRLGAGASMSRARRIKNYSELRARSACPAFSCSVAKLTARALKFTLARNFTIASRSSRITKPRSWISGCSRLFASSFSTS